MCLAEAEEDNVWLNYSELSVAGRPLKAESIMLPRQKDLVLPESTDPNSDLRTAERQRPSHVEVRAQKGRGRLAAVFRSLLTMSEYKNMGPCILINFSGYVEDAALAVPCASKGLNPTLQP